MRIMKIPRPKSQNPNPKKSVGLGFGIRDLGFGIFLVAALVAVGHIATVRAEEHIPLIDAARSANTAALRALLNQRVDVNEAAADGTTALHWASYRDNLESADLLIRAGARVNAENDLGATPLWTASMNGSAAMVRTLLQAGADPNLALLLGETPLMAASRSGNPDASAELLDKGANVNARGPRGQTALMWAVSEQHPEVVKILLAHGADLHAKSDVWRDMMAVPPHGKPEYNRLIPHGGDTALMFAARVGDLASAKLLLAAGANVNDADAWGVSAMVLAAHSGFTELVEFLLDNGADANAIGPGFTALHEAVMRRDERMVDALLAHGANPNTPLQTWTPERRSSADFNFAPSLVGATPFWLAAHFREPAIMRLLVKQGADPLFVLRNEYYVNDFNDRRTQASTALLAALGIGGGRAWVLPDRAQLEALVLESVQLAIVLGVDVNAVNTDGRTALDVARASKIESIVNVLVAHGAKEGKPGPPSAR
jgi:ankyrin repeat protein